MNRQIDLTLRKADALGRAFAGAHVQPATVTIEAINLHRAIARHNLRKARK